MYNLSEATQLEINKIFKLFPRFFSQTLSAKCQGG